ncbi:hypothetical protein HDR60_00875 [bacterium]|nr:hypothetical protein [bacterium]
MKKINELLKIKPSIEEFENCVKIGKNFWKNSMKEQCKLVEKQKEEHRKLKPSPELYKIEFTL